MDGPTPDIDKLGGVDLARDGTGGVVYLKRVDGAPHVFVSRFNGGQFRPPERVDNGIGAGATERGDRGRRRRPARRRVDRGQRASTAASCRATTSSRGRSSARPSSTTTPPARSTDVAIDMGINGAAYAVVGRARAAAARTSAPRACRTWRWTPVGAPLDIDPGHAAGRGSQRPRVAVSAEGNAIVAWGEDHADGRARVYARRVTGLNPSAFPQEALADRPRRPGRRARGLDRHRHRGRRLVRLGRLPPGLRRRLALGRAAAARLDLRPAVPLDGGPPTARPRIAINGRGQGLAALQGGGGVLGAFNYNDVFEPGAAAALAPRRRAPSPSPPPPSTAR